MGSIEQIFRIKLNKSVCKHKTENSVEYLKLLSLIIACDKRLIANNASKKRLESFKFKVDLWLLSLYFAPQNCIYTLCLRLNLCSLKVAQMIFLLPKSSEFWMDVVVVAAFFTFNALFHIEIFCRRLLPSLPPLPMLLLLLPHLVFELVKQKGVKFIWI